MTKKQKLLCVLLLITSGIGVVWYIKKKKPQPQNNSI